MNEDGYVYESKRRPSTANSHLEKSNGTIDLKFWSTNSVHIDTTLRVRSSFHLIPSVHFISLNFIVSHRVFFFFLFFPLSLSLSLTFMRFSISISPSAVAPFFFLRHFFFSRTLFVRCLLSPFGSFHPRFPRRLIFFVIVPLFSSSLSLPLSRSLLPAAPIIASHAVCFSMRHHLCYRFVSFCASFLFDFLPRSLVALVYHS